MRRTILNIIFLSACVLASAQQSEKLFLSGTGSDATVEWDFFCTAGRGSGSWTRIAVPSCWECQGFGQYTYGHMPDEQRINECGRYKYRFNVPAAWKGRRVSIVFAGVMTEADVRINGVSAGPKHCGGYYEFSYDVSSILKYGRSNLLEVDVAKHSSDKSIVGAERHADFWVYGGIFRPVWLEAAPAVSIADYAVDAKADGSIRIDADIAGNAHGTKLSARIVDAAGEPVGEPLTAEVAGEGRLTLRGSVDSPALWSAEYPNLYSLELSLEREGRPLHTIGGKFGFRTVELRPCDGMYVNGEKIKFRGVNRHSHWPTTGRTLNRSINLQDALLIKEMNMNAVRMSHYPPERDFLDICDSLGLYVIDELTGWQDAYSTEAGAPLVRELIARDKNHPCVVLWSNGNEGGFNFDLVPLYSQYDIQQRPVIHPWQRENGWNTFHYPSWETVRRILASTRDVYFPTEFLHGLYDGGHGAGLEDYWELMQASPRSAGGFLWDLIDQGLVRDDRGGELDTDGDHAADGIVGPYREKEGSFYAIKDIWCPVQLKGGSYLPEHFDGRIAVENRYSFTNLKDCRFEAKYKKIDFVTGKEAEVTVAVASPDIAPGAAGVLEIPLPDKLQTFDCLTITARDPHGKDLYSWTRTIRRAAQYAAGLLTPADCRALFGADGRLSGLESGGKLLPLSGGPRPVSGKPERSKLEVKQLDNGWVEVEYAFRQNGNFDNVGVSFDLPESAVKSMRWLGDGPYRVWKNRLRGAEFGLWSKDRNDSATGQDCKYPEFKGYHAGMYAADILTDYGTLRIVFASDDLFLRLYTPKYQGNDHVAGRFPEGDISVLSAISPIGTKFCDASAMGPASQRNSFDLGHGPEAALKMHFYMTFIP